MSDVFPKWTNTLPLKLVVGVALVGAAVTAGAWYYLTPKYSRVGYQPTQPVPFSHAVSIDAPRSMSARCKAARRLRHSADRVDGSFSRGPHFQVFSQR